MKMIIDIDKNVYSMILDGDIYVPLSVLVAFQTATLLDFDITDYEENEK